MQALGKKRGPEDDRNEGQRFHDALAEACHLLLRARLVFEALGGTVLTDCKGKFALPRLSDQRFHWITARMAALDPEEMREFIIDAWRMVVPKKVAAARLGPGGIGC